MHGITTFCILAVASALHLNVDVDVAPLMETGSQFDVPGTLFKLTGAAAVADNAVCLDGTPGAYYFRSGSGSGANKWYVHHQGGGWCDSPASCAGRALTDLGSSKAYPVSQNLGGGYFSQNSTENPMMYNWNVAFLRYCDGGSFSGSNSSVTVAPNKQILHFRGKHILHAVVDELIAKHGLSRATDMVISGCSAGGLATYLHVDYWKQRAPAAAHVVGLPDSGFFLDFEGPPKYHSRIRWVFDFMNCSSGVNEMCVKDKQAAGDSYRCMFAEHVSPYIRVPIFPLQPEYDSWQIANNLGNNSTGIVNNWGATLTTLVNKNLLARSQNGVFLDSCVHHCGGWSTIHIDGDVQAVAFQKWYTDPARKAQWVQKQPYVCAACCHAQVSETM